MNSNQEFQTIWVAALDNYRNISGIDLTSTPNLPSDIESLKQQINTSQSNFEDFREKREKLWNTLSVVGGHVRTLSQAAGETASESFAAGPLMMGAITILINGASGVTKSYDYVGDSLQRIGSILSRLKVHTEQSVSPELRVIYARILSCTLEIVAVSTKYVTQGRARRWWKRTKNPEADRARDLRKELEDLVKEETAMVGALTLSSIQQVHSGVATIQNFSQSANTGLASANTKLDNLVNSMQQTSLNSQVAPQILITLNFKISFAPPFLRNPNFMGRDRQLQDIHNYFTNWVFNGTPCHLALTGTGGMGKTQIAVEYAYRYQQSYNSIFWISAASKDSIRISFVKVLQQIVDEQVKSMTWPGTDLPYAAIAAKLGLSGAMDNNGIVNSDPNLAQRIQNAFFSWLQLPGNDRWLLIFDNADDVDPENFRLHEYFPPHGHGFIFITSRRPEFSAFAEQISLDGLDQVDAMNLLLQHSGLEVFSVEDEADAAILAETLGFFPLSIVQAASYIKKTGIDIRDYLPLYEKQFELAHSQGPTIAWDYHKTAANTWEISLDAIAKKDKEAVTFLSICSYLDREEIEQRFWYNRSDESDEHTIRNRVALLASYSLIKTNRNEGTFSIHPVVHTWSRERLDETSKLDTMLEVLNFLADVLNIPDLDLRNIAWSNVSYRKLGSHYRYFHYHLVRHFDKLIQYAGSQSLLENMYSLCWSTGAYWGNTNHNNDAVYYYELACKIYQNIDGMDNIVLCDLMSNTAQGLMLARRFTEALEQNMQVLAILEKQGQGTNCFRVLFNMATIFSRMNQFEEKSLYFKRALEIYDASPKPKILELDTSFEGFSVIVHGPQDRKETLEWINEEINNFGKAYGYVDDMAKAALHVTRLLLRTARYYEGLRWAKLIILYCEQRFSPDHIAHRLVVAAIAEGFSSMGKLDESIKWNSEAVRISLLTGNEDNRLAFTFSNLGGTYERKQEYATAAEYHKRGLNILWKLYGTRDERAAWVAHRAATALYKGRINIDEARELMNGAFRTLEDIWGRDDKRLFAEHYSFGKLLFDIDRYKEAAREFKVALDGEERILGKEDGCTKESREWYEKSVMYSLRPPNIEQDPIEGEPECLNESRHDPEKELDD